MYVSADLVLYEGDNIATLFGDGSHAHLSWMSGLGTVPDFSPAGSVEGTGFLSTVSLPCCDCFSAIVEQIDSCVNMLVLFFTITWGSHITPRKVIENRKNYKFGGIWTTIYNA